MTRLINPVPQFLDGEGDPLPLGLLYVYEAGTSTPKNTYNDPEETVANTNPVVLDSAGRLPDVYYTGLARLVLKTSAGLQIWDKDEIGSGTSFEQFGEWQSFVTYDANDFVFRSGKIYQSLANGNQGNDPSLTPGANANWLEVRFVGTYNSTVTYSAGDVVRTSTGNLWKSLVGANTANNPETDGGSNWIPAVSGDKVPEVATLEARTTTSVVQTGGGTLSALRVNTFTDSSTYTLPLASSVSANQWIDLELEDKYKAQNPTVQRGGSDTIEWSGVTDTEILFDADSSIKLRLYSDGVSVWRF